MAVGIAGEKLYVLNAQCKDKPENEQLISVLREVRRAEAVDSTPTLELEVHMGREN